ncbi:hypothetical protein DY000_02022054 [Brassica cretica]|uniref:Uncharacterized protein n=1 Tax=Brassica cretica TaxID=69181 RepID=A0ABQ7EAV5_BRACR|nr:hypothetical protein DY000_02022054 [Brassica cretica]
MGILVTWWGFWASNGLERCLSHVLASLLIDTNAVLSIDRHGFRPDIDRQNNNNIKRRVDEIIGRRCTPDIGRRVEETSIDDTPLEAGKCSLTNHANEEVVLGEPKGQLRNAINQIINGHGTAIPVKINSTSNRDKEIKLSLQDYLNPGRTYSNSTRSPEEANHLIKNVPTGRSYEMMDVERGRRVDSIDKPYFAEIKESLESLHSILDEQNQFGIYQIDDDVLSDLEQQVDFVDNPTLKDRYPNPDTDSFTRNYDATVGSRRGRAKFRLNQAFTRNRKMATDHNGNINIIYSELMRKFDPLINVVLLRSGKHLTPSTIDINYAEKPGELEKTGESRSRPILLDNPDPGPEPSREKERSNTGKSGKATINLDEEDEESEEDVKIDRQEGNNIDRPTTDFAALSSQQVAN